MTEARAQATHVIDRRFHHHRSRPSSRNSRRRRTSCRACWDSLLAISENYPDLKSNQNFLALQSQLEGTENRIEIARRDYNSAVQDYNTELVTIPGSLWAATLYKTYKQATPFAASAAAQAAPVVSFPGASTPAARASCRPAGTSRNSDAAVSPLSCLSVSADARAGRRRLSRR